MKELLKDLSQSISVSGDEHAFSDKLLNMFSPFCTSVSKDDFGNVRAYIDAGRPETLVIESHIDEIGLIVTKCCDNGFLKFTNIGGIDAKILPATEVIVHGKQDYFGIITAHVPSENDGKPLRIEDLYIDIGVVDSKIEVGDYISFKSNPQNMLEDCMIAKSLDNRVGVGVLLETAKACKGKSLAYNIELISAVQEEIGCRGAEMICLNDNVSAVIVIDATHGISPVVDENSGFSLDEGVAIGAGPSLSRQITQKLKDICREQNFPYTVEVCAGNSGTDAWKFQTKNCGTPCGLVSVPLRYMHTPSEVVNVNTCRQLVTILENLLLKRG
ncbi:MAG: M20/M25/M40 family metallo-hydrolase [Clostridiales bacterium]|jgi:endoglucanase|nr:M20/M25/M40 family metallo-hydrolase [Clostridiales bacterium]